MSHELIFISMKSIRGHLLFVFLIFLIACGPSAQERAKRRQALEDSIEQERAQYEGMQNRQAYLAAELVAARDRLEVIKQPQFLRTPVEREKQIIDQVMRITELEKNLEDPQLELKRRLEGIEVLNRTLLELGE